jgi:RNA-directed DNA polymerase
MEARPSRKSVRRVKRKLHEVLRPWNTGAWPEVADRVNRVLVGWSGYFGHGTVYYAYRAVDNHPYDRVRHFLRRRHRSSPAARACCPRARACGRGASCGCWT